MSDSGESVAHLEATIAGVTGGGANAKTAEYGPLVEKLSHYSVEKHFDAYADVDWDSPEMRIDPSDPRLELLDDDPLARTAWYQSRPQEVRAAIGLHMMASFMKIGIQFESVLQRGLLEFAWHLPNHAPEFRYAYHEVIEEGHHSLMFQEFVNRSGFDVPGLPKIERTGARRVIRFGYRFPELFFFFVLGGEEPIDYVQRQMMKRREALHPLVARISQIHMTEEARHLAFARAYLRRNVPNLGWFKIRRLRLAVPFILGQMSARMTRPGAHVIAEHGIPNSVIVEAYDRNPEAHRRLHDATAGIRELCIELGLIRSQDERRWKRYGLWPAEA